MFPRKPTTISLSSQDVAAILVSKGQSAQELLKWLKNANTTYPADGPVVESTAMPNHSPKSSINNNSNPCDEPLKEQSDFSSFQTDLPQEFNNKQPWIKPSLPNILQTAESALENYLIKEETRQSEASKNNSAECSDLTNSSQRRRDIPVETRNRFESQTFPEETICDPNNHLNAEPSQYRTALREIVALSNPSITSTYLNPTETPSNSRCQHNSPQISLNFNSVSSASTLTAFQPPIPGHLNLETNFWQRVRRFSELFSSLLSDKQLINTLIMVVN